MKFASYWAEIVPDNLARYRFIKAIRLFSSFVQRGLVALTRRARSDFAQFQSCGCGPKLNSAEHYAWLNAKSYPLK